jgi:hypothetical protein
VSRDDRTRYRRSLKVCFKLREEIACIQRARPKIKSRPLSFLIGCVIEDIFQKNSQVLFGTIQLIDMISGVDANGARPMMAQIQMTRT